jgi:hypothetical protein
MTGLPYFIGEVPRKLRIEEYVANLIGSPQENNMHLSILHANPESEWRFGFRWLGDVLRGSIVRRIETCNRFHDKTSVKGFEIAPILSSGRSKSMPLDSC